MSSGAMLKQRLETNNKMISIQFYNKMYRQRADFIRFVCIRIAAAVDKINKMVDCQLSRLERSQVKFLLLISSNDCIIK